MEKNSQDFLDAMRRAQSPAGQQLLSLLQSTDNARLQKAREQALSGDYDQVKKTLSAMLSSPEAQALLKKLGG